MVKSQFLSSNQTLPIMGMSESATIIKLFFRSIIPKITVGDTLQAAGAEDKPLLGSKLSADSGAKTRLGLGES